MLLQHFSLILAVCALALRSFEPWHDREARLLTVHSVHLVLLCIQVSHSLLLIENIGHLELEPEFLLLLFCHVADDRMKSCLVEVLSLPHLTSKLFIELSLLVPWFRRCFEAGEEGEHLVSLSLCLWVVIFAILRVERWPAVAAEIFIVVTLVLDFPMILICNYRLCKCWLGKILWALIDVLDQKLVDCIHAHVSLHQRVEDNTC